jgi:hypothetical protein
MQNRYSFYAGTKLNSFTENMLAVSYGPRLKTAGEGSCSGVRAKILERPTVIS